MRPSEPRHKSTVAAQEQGALYAERVKQLYSNAFVGLLASVISSLVLVVIQRNVTPRPVLIAWAALLATISLLRYNDVRAFWRKSPDASEAVRWGRRFIGGLVLSGMAWGSSAIFLFPVGSLEHQTFLAFMIGGMVAGAAAAFSSVTTAFLAFSLLALCPIIVRFAILGGEFHLTMGSMVLLFGVMMFFISKSIKADRMVSVKLRYENRELLSSAEERAEELHNAYERLKEETRERERAEFQLRQTGKMEALGTLAGGIAHDFNNILAAIIGFSEMALDKTPEGATARRPMERVFAAGLRGRDLVKQILTFSRRAEQAKRPLKLEPVVRDTLKLLRASLPTTIDIRTDLRNGGGTVLADSTQMQQIVMNLCTNATHAMRRTGGSISVELASSIFSLDEDAPDPTMSPGSYAKLSVRDTGEGIPPEIVDHIFDPFFTTKTRGEGTGLGLSVVHGIVKQHEGYITVESELGKGSVFTVYLPQITDEPATNSASGDEIPTGSERILFVDDEEALAEMAKDILGELGYEVTFKRSSREAFALFTAGPSRFDLVITDQTMPEMTGIDLAKEMLAVNADIPIIMSTGYSDLVDAESAVAMGIRGFVMKPLTKREIAKTIRKVLDR